MQNYVFVLDANRKSCDAVHPAAARILLRDGKASILRRTPFTIILKETSPEKPKYSYSAKFDYGSRTTGIAVVRERGRFRQVVWACELQHQGHIIKKRMDDRRSQRRGRRHRKTRYRKARFNNRRRAADWLPPSTESRVSNIDTWAGRFRRWLPLTTFAVEHVKFDMQKMRNPEVSGVQYQQGELAGYEVRQYLLEKWGHKCAYCDAENIPLQIEHIVPRARGGTNSVSNLTLACERCNRKKGATSIEKFLAKDSERLEAIKSRMHAPLKDAAAVNRIRWLVLDRLEKYGLPIETGSGGLTKYNRTKQGYGKAHFVDAACVGFSGRDVDVDENLNILYVKAMGHGNRQFVLCDENGFPRTKPRQRVRTYFGFGTGDLVRANVPQGKNKGVHKGRVSVRETGSFRINDADGINHMYCKKIQGGDGYLYTTKKQKIEEQRKKARKKQKQSAGARIPLTTEITSILRAKS